MAFSFRKDHLKKFKNTAQCGVWRNRLVAPWTQSVGIGDLGEEATARPLSRSFLRQLSADDSVSDRDVLWSILAWGGMMRDAARRLKAHESCWIQIIEKLRRDGQNQLDRSDSYRICLDTVQKINRGGIGPAYFTKLIFFANPSHDGYIMDQWTSRSVNLLIDGPAVVQMCGRHRVCPHNDAKSYEKFCNAIEALSKLINKTPEETEQCLFSTGGRNPAPWRLYVRNRG